MPLEHATHLANPIRFSDVLDITGTPASLAVARHFLKRTLQHWGISSVVDDMLTVGGELVTNAVDACGEFRKTRQWQANGASTLIRVRMLSFSSSVAVEVWDRLPGEPELRPFDPTLSTHQLPTTGRGLQMVEALSVRWGFYPVAPWGKVVWAELEVGDQAVSA
ncbi:ATP-binding protein [Actinomadura chibensis]|uniref:ATP-binding protein n=1 Tax=Actinomadura chibensis TaxID=392828 RepID=A0A5D0NIM3_9ACTN|nr:ATP-binding protein [Actinomadura chibensis]TYB44199.1 ATP-binding protein [Actinomadura chibensis]